MAMSDLVILREAVFAALDAVASAEPTPVPVHDHAPIKPPEMYVRMDGFNFGGDEYKNPDTGRHTFMVHVFLKPVDGANSSQGGRAAILLMMKLHDAIKAVRVDGKRTFHIELEEAPSKDGVTSHVFSRYSINL